MDKKLPAVSPKSSEDEALQDYSLTTPTCLHCGCEHHGVYCLRCGQRYDVKRLGWKEVLSTRSGDRRIHNQF